MIYLQYNYGKQNNRLFFTVCDIHKIPTIKHIDLASMPGRWTQATFKGMSQVGQSAEREPMESEVPGSISTLVLLLAWISFKRINIIRQMWTCFQVYPC